MAAMQNAMSPLHVHDEYYQVRMTERETMCVSTMQYHCMYLTLGEGNIIVCA